MSSGHDAPDFSKLQTTSVVQRQWYDTLFYALCVLVATLSIIVLGILLTTIVASAIPVIGPHTDALETENRLAFVQSGDDEESDLKLSKGDLLQGIFNAKSLLRGGLGESNDEKIEQGSLIGIYSFEFKTVEDQGDSYGACDLTPASGENNVGTLLQNAGFKLESGVAEQSAIILLENKEYKLDLSEAQFNQSIVHEGQIAALIRPDDSWKVRMVLGFDSAADFIEVAAESLDVESFQMLRTNKRGGKLNCLLSVLSDSENSSYQKVRNLRQSVSQLMDGDVKIEDANLVGISRRKNKRRGFDLASEFELEYCPLPETDASAIGHTAHFLRETTKTNPSEAGIGPAMVGSLWVIIGCVLFALPIGVATAVFLEEFKPTNRVLLFFHNLIQLNIANLAGVPSIVYGILGLTAFVYMFGDVSSNPSISSEPAYSFGAKHYYQYLTEGMIPILIPVSDPANPPELVDGMNAQTTTGDAINLKIIGPDDEYPEDEATLKYALSHDSEGGIISRKPWYYLQVPLGRGVLAASLTLMLVILPVVIIATQEALRSVPSSLREGALGLGSTQWQVVRKITLPAAIPSIMTGAILAMSRAIGEAAPILILCGIVYVTSGPSHLMDDYSVLPIQIYYWAKEPIDRAATINFQNIAAAGIVVLLVVLLTFNAIAILIRQFTQKPLS